MTLISTARANPRALIAAASLGSAFGLVLGGFYLAGGMAHAVSTHARIERIVGVASEGFSDEALRAGMGKPTGSVLQMALRHDTGFVPSATRRDLQTAVLSARLERRAHIDGVATGKLEFRHQALQVNYAPTAAIRPYPLQHPDALRDARDLDCLTRAVYYEARGETPSGQAAVAQVVLNRLRHPAFPKTVCGVVFQRTQGGQSCQFSFACDGSQNARRDAAAWRRAERVAARALDGAVMTSIGSATHFHTTQVAPYWSDSLKQVAQIGLHVFYRFSGRAQAQPDQDDASPPATELANKPIYASLVPQMADTAPEAKPAASPPKDPVPASTISTVKPAEASQATIKSPPAQPSSVS